MTFAASADARPRGRTDCTRIEGAFSQRPGAGASVGETTALSGPRQGGGDFRSEVSEKIEISSPGSDCEREELVEVCLEHGHRLEHRARERPEGDRAKHRRIAPLSPEAWIAWHVKRLSPAGVSRLMARAEVRRERP